VLVMLSGTQFWVDVCKIIVIDVLLSGDNAIVIALACRNLPVAQRKKGILLGLLGAIALRVVLTFCAVSMLALPYLRLVGAFLLIWIGVKLLLPENGHGEDTIKADTRLFGAVKTIIIADFVMSLDNVLGVAATAKGNLTLLVFGLLISIPLIAWSSRLVLKVIDRFPVLIFAGGALLGYVAGEMLVSEAYFAPMLARQPYMQGVAPVACALLVLGLGRWFARRKENKSAVVDLLHARVDGRQTEK